MSGHSYHTQRVIALLDREQIDFLDRLGKDALFTSGTKLSRTKIISAMINIMEKIGLNAKGVGSIEELEHRMEETMKKSSEKYLYSQDVDAA